MGYSKIHWIVIYNLRKINPKLFTIRMKKIFLISIFYIFFFYSNSFAFLEFKQSKDISSDTDDLKMSSNYNFLSEVPDYGANIEILNKF